jgi:HEPN domain-containing protein
MTTPGSASNFGPWVERAEHDLRAAEYTLTLEEDCPFDTVCFHAQQCAEKYLKALLISREISFPFIHDLTELRALLPQPERAALADIALETLNPYIVEGRYPGDWDPIDRAEAEDAVATARRIRDAIRSRLLESSSGA